MDYRPGVGTITPATAGTPGNCRLQKATHRRQPPPLDVQKRTQSRLLNRINTAFPRPCQVENRGNFAQVPELPRLSLPVYVHVRRSPLEFFSSLPDTTERCPLAFVPVSRNLF